MSRESFEQIGIVVATFQRVEHLLLWILGERWTSENGEVFNWWICAGRFTDILEKVSELTSGEISEAEHRAIFEKPWGTIPQLHQIRNDWVHSYYRFDQSSAPAITAKIRSVRWEDFQALRTDQMVEAARKEKVREIESKGATNGKNLEKLNAVKKAESECRKQAKEYFNMNPPMYQIQKGLPDNEEFKRFTVLAARAIEDLEKLIKTNIDPVARRFEDAGD